MGIEELTLIEVERRFGDTGLNYEQLEYLAKELAKTIENAFDNCAIKCHLLEENEELTALGAFVVRNAVKKARKEYKKAGF